MAFLTCSCVPAQFSDSDYLSKTYVFNLTGSFHGNGDVVAPMWAAIRFKQQDHEINCVLLVDDRALDIIQTSTSMREAEFEKKNECQIVHEKDISKIPVADVSFEMFIGGRKLDNFYNRPYNNKNTIVIVSDTMHGDSLDWVRVYGLEFFCMPPGIGKERSGLIVDPDLDLYRYAPTWKPVLASNEILDAKLKQVISNAGTGGYLIGFSYGTHNELKDSKLHGQTESFLRSLSRKYPAEKIIVMTPNSVEALKAVVHDYPVYSSQDLPPEADWPETPFLCSVGKVTSKKFVALMSVADVPVFVEGDNSIGQAILMDKNFLVMRSPWNGPAIQALLEFDPYSSIYKDLYNLSDLNVPNWDIYFSKEKRTTSYPVRDFFDKLKNVLSVAKRFRIQKSKTDFVELSSEAFEKTHDRYLQYSIILSAVKAGFLGSESLEAIQQKLQSKQVDWMRLQERMVTRDPPHRR